MTHSIPEAAAILGISYATLRKHISRGKIATTTIDGRARITQEAIDAYVAQRDLSTAVREMTGKEPVKAGLEFGNSISRLPQTVRDAILDGIPTTKRQGGPEAFRKATKGLNRREVPEVPETTDPHRGFPVGHRHADTPRWKRIDGDTWSADGSSWTWNGLFWEAGGKIEGRGPLPDGISPADPNSDRRPLIPSTQVKK